MRSTARRSATVTLTLLSGVAAAVLTACRSEERRTCVDQQDVVVPDSLCARRGRGSLVGAAAMWYPYRYYYGGAGYAGVGSRMRGGAYTPRSSVGPRAGTGTARGGFGGIGRGTGSARA